MSILFACCTNVLESKTDCCFMSPEVPRLKLFWPSDSQARLCPTLPHRKPHNRNLCLNPDPNSRKPRPNLHPKRERNGKRSLPHLHAAPHRRLWVKMMVRHLMNHVQFCGSWQLLYNTSLTSVCLFCFFPTLTLRPLSCFQSLYLRFLSPPVF